MGKHFNQSINCRLRHHEGWELWASIYFSSLLFFLPFHMYRLFHQFYFIIPIKVDNYELPSIFFSAILFTIPYVSCFSPVFFLSFRLRLTTMSFHLFFFSAILTLNWEDDVKLLELDYFTEEDDDVKLLKLDYSLKMTMSHHWNWINSILLKSEIVSSF